MTFKKLKIFQKNWSLNLNKAIKNKMEKRSRKTNRKRKKNKIKIKRKVQIKRVKMHRKKLVLVNKQLLKKMNKYSHNSNKMAIIRS